MSLSPIFSMMRDFLIRVTGTGSLLVLLGPKLSDMCIDLLATLLFSIVVGFFLPDKDGEFAFLLEEADGKVFVGVGLELLGVEI